MSTAQRLERDLPAILGDLSVGPYPDYIDDVLATTAQRRQRPAWAFPERWLPVDITNHSTIVPRVPWRSIAVAFVILALIVGAALAYVGSHQTRLPEPFGPAANGLIPFASNGDLYLGDLATGQTRPLVTSPDEEAGAITSSDGTRVVFARDIAGTTTTDVYVIGIDGSGARRITPQPIDRLTWGAWLPAGDRLALLHEIGDPVAGCSTMECRLTQLDVVEASGNGVLKTIASAVGMNAIQFRPPDGRELLYRALVDGKWGLFAMDPDGANVRPIVPPTADDQMDLTFAGAAYSADGSRIFFNQTTSDASNGDTGCCQLFVVNADGTNLHRFVPADNGTWDGDPVVSPDGKWVAFWHNLPNQATQQVAVIAADGTGPVILTGPELSGGAHWVWSPDSTKILMFQNDTDAAKAWLLDPAGGPATTVPWASNGDLDWQRLALPE